MDFITKDLHIPIAFALRLSCATLRVAGITTRSVVQLSSTISIFEVHLTR